MGLTFKHFFLITQNYLYFKEMRTKAKGTAAYVHIHQQRLQTQRPLARNKTLGSGLCDSRACVEPESGRGTGVQNLLGAEFQFRSSFLSSFL